MKWAARSLMLPAVIYSTRNATMCAFNNTHSSSSCVLPYWANCWAASLRVSKKVVIVMPKNSNWVASFDKTGNNLVIARDSTVLAAVPDNPVAVDVPAIVKKLKDK